MALLNFEQVLAWSNYPPPRQTPPADAEPNTHAYTYIELLPRNARLTGRPNHVSIASIDLAISFTPARSWVLSSHAYNTDLLKHEQGHYDITALAGRDIYPELIALTAVDAHALTRAVQALLDRARITLRTLHHRYDDQTRHGQNREAQRTWDNAFTTQKAIPNGSASSLPQ